MASSWRPRMRSRNSVTAVAFDGVGERAAKIGGGEVLGTLGAVMLLPVAHQAVGEMRFAGAAGTEQREDRRSAMRRRRVPVDRRSSSRLTAPATRRFSGPATNARQRRRGRVRRARRSGRGEAFGRAGGSR